MKTKLLGLIVFFSTILLQNTTAQIINTYAGTGTAAYNGDGGAASNAQINFPYAITMDAAGNLYIADCSNNRIRKVSPSGIISTIAGTGVAGFSGDGGAAINAKMYYPVGITTDTSGNVYFVDRLNYRVRKINTMGIISTIVGTGTSGFSGDGGPATSAQINLSAGLAIDGTGALYLCDQGNNRVRKINVAGTISTYAGTGVAGFSGDGGAATSAQVNFLLGITIDASNTLYLADGNNNRIRKINNSGIISTIAGNGAAGFSGDGGAAINAELNAPGGATMDAAGNLYIADYSNHRIRKVDQSGNITTFAGTGASGFSGDGGLANAAQLNNPFIVAFDITGNMYISDRSNSRIRKIACVQPTITASSSSSLICTGQSATLSANGASTFTWNPGGTGANISVTPTVTSNYTVTGTSSVTGCGSSTVVTQNVSICTGVLNNINEQNFEFKTYPNPSNGSFKIQINTEIENGTIRLLNSIGQKVYEQKIIQGVNEINITELPAGLYNYIFFNGRQQINNGKLLIE